MLVNSAASLIPRYTHHMEEAHWCQTSPRWEEDPTMRNKSSFCLVRKNHLFPPSLQAETVVKEWVEPLSLGEGFGLQIQMGLPKQPPKKDKIPGGLKNFSNNLCPCQPPLACSATFIHSFILLPSPPQKLSFPSSLSCFSTGKPLSSESSVL